MTSPTIEDLINEWFYEHALEEPDQTCTLVLHETHDNGAKDQLAAQLRTLMVRERIDELSNVQLEYDGYRLATTFVDGKMMSIENRIAELEATIKSDKEEADE